jgi:hypothetical protein
MTHCATDKLGHWNNINELKFLYLNTALLSILFGVCQPNLYCFDIDLIR